MSRFILLFSLVAATVPFFAGCNQESNTVVSKAYHNLTAHYNAYYLAEERYLLQEERVWENQNDDYNQILPYYPNLDTTFGKSLESDLRYSIDKCKLPINKHKNSHWVDDSYLLIGKCLYQMGKLDSATQVFRFVNVKSSDPFAQHQALMWLLRTYMTVEDEDYAFEVYNYLVKEEQDIAPKNQRDFHLIMYEYHRQMENEDLLPMLEHITKAIPLIKNHDQRSRAHFIAGQIQQRLNNDKESYFHYSKALRHTPAYEIEFNTKLNRSRVSEVEKGTTVAKTYKTFDKMLEDLKNKEYRDRIYYEMALYELKRGNLNKCFEFLTRSVKENGVNKNQKAYSYLLAGQLYYDRGDEVMKDNVRRYTTSKRYYDSTVNSMDVDFREFEAIRERQEILSDFVDQITIIGTQDSLIALSEMSPEEQERIILAQIEADKARMKEELERKRVEEEEARRNEQEGQTTFGPSNFILYDKIAMIDSRQKFTERWGLRPLEDNWRRSQKEIEIEDTETPEEDSVVAEIDSTQNQEAAPDEIVIDKQDYYDKLPKSDAEREKARAEVDEAMYRLGKIYNLQLNETENAIVTFNEHLKRFPDSEYEAEILYIMFVICQNSGLCDGERYKQQELLEYPNSIYARLMEDPDYATSNLESNQMARRSYTEALNKYQRNDFLGARKVLIQVQQQYPFNDIVDHVEFLRIMTFAKTDQWIYYHKALGDFVEDYGTSDLVPHALAAMELNKTRLGISKDDTESLADTNFVPGSGEHFVIARFYDTEVKPSASLPNFYKFHADKYSDKTFETKKISFGDSTYIISVKRFESLAEGEDYLATTKHYNDFKDYYEKVDYNYYLITPKNYNTLLTTKNLDGYKEFYRKNYKTNF